MFKKPEERKSILTLGGREYGSIDIRGCKTLTAACVRLQDCMNGIARWKHPSLQLFFDSGEGVSGLMTAKESLFLVYIEDEEQKMKKIDGSMFGLSKNAELEELLFNITKQVINDIRENADAWVDSLLVPKRNYPEEELDKKKKTFKRAMLRVAESLEESEVEAEKQYRIPEILKGQMLMIEQSKKNALTANRQSR